MSIIVLVYARVWYVVAAKGRNFRLLFANIYCRKQRVRVSSYELYKLLSFVMVLCWIMSLKWCMQFWWQKLCSFDVFWVDFSRFKRRDYNLDCVSNFLLRKWSFYFLFLKFSSFYELGKESSSKPCVVLL